MDLRTVRIAVVGDSGVGKTSLVHFVCHGTVLAHPTWTIGCTTEVLLHQNDTFVEFVDIGGNPRYELSRAAFYHELHGIIFVYDMSNIRSYNNLRKWITELSLAQKNRPHAVANPDNVPHTNRCVADVGHWKQARCRPYATYGTSSRLKNGLP
ncbi:hypothetical protein, variant [Aphanomyces astaci]|uniref:Uncharacterized protein n=1 Tax=Aphanomyces astaci TaxID=112090 RepID=W4GV94_APHAT|nr:hypothetical protein, variant [Aphanomyces astaci]ETV83577.1 hypothetical protein, variant [Aphanomyces astaci]|eukprot:XP_009827007.1 hypothetical protein, variant [Aphanomyces astaci]